MNPPKYNIWVYGLLTYRRLLAHHPSMQVSTWRVFVSTPSIHLKNNFILLNYSSFLPCSLNVKFILNTLVCFAAFILIHTTIDKLSQSNSDCKSVIFVYDYVIYTCNNKWCPSPFTNISYFLYSASELVLLMNLHPQEHERWFNLDLHESMCVALQYSKIESCS